MPEFPEITILICTYNRPKELIQNLEALRENTVYAEGKIKYVVCDDATPSYLSKLKTKPIWKELQPTFVSTKENSGWGVNVNNGLSHCDTAYVFFIEDDYILTDYCLNLAEAVALMEVKPDIGMVRFRGTAGHHLVYHGFEADISSYYDDYRQGLGLPGKINYLQLDGGSPDLYIYSHGAHLKHRRFHQFYGTYPEGLLLGQTEEHFAHTVKDGMQAPGAPAIVILPEWIPMRFDHIGQSYQLTDKDKSTHAQP